MSWLQKPLSGCVHVCVSWLQADELYNRKEIDYNDRLQQQQHNDRLTAFDPGQPG